MSGRGPAEVARLTGVSVSAIQGNLRGKAPSAQTLFSLAKGLKVDAEWLATGEGVPDPIGHELVRITRYAVHLSAGPGSWLERAEERDPLVFSRDWLVKVGAPDGNGLFVLDNRGDSMEPTIRDGAAVLVDGRDLRFSDGIWAFALGDELRLKRLRRGLRSLQVISDNTAYPPEEIGPADEDALRLIGRAIWVGQAV
jgi:phage repressor protein C with HTH and peptisase S24 domain